VNSSTCIGISVVLRRENATCGIVSPRHNGASAAIGCGGGRRNQR
jgi:hypothetical protein